MTKTQAKKKAIQFAIAMLEGGDLSEVFGDDYLDEDENALDDGRIAAIDRLRKLIGDD